MVTSSEQERIKREKGPANVSQPSEPFTGSEPTEAESESSPPPVEPTSSAAKVEPPQVDRRAPYHPTYVPLWNNVITLVGLFTCAAAILLLLTFALFTAVAPTTNPYVDILGYLVLPSVLIGGIVIIPLGIFFKSWRLHRRDPSQHLAFRFPRIDLNDPMQRRVAKVFGGGAFIMLPIIGVSSYHGFHYTDSSEFCGKVCHTVMEPQSTSYENSPHARVACAECHIGSGASWFVKAKLSGTRQVLAVLRDTFSRPIPPAIHNLRPARETCEHCHWPKKFFGAQLREIVHFTADESNTRRDIDMLLNTGGGDEVTGRAEGIHLHMALEGRIEYVATDDFLQVIPWVRYTDGAGNEWIYRSDGRPSSDPTPDGDLRQLDCMDCHNRPAHNFRSPEHAVDIFLDVGRIDTTLPFIKREAVRALVGDYPDSETAERRIGESLTGFYEANYPAVWEKDKASVKNAVDMVRQIYGRNFFPAMKVNWKTYPDNIGHMESPGCFRCHEGRHVNQKGEKISHDCTICHTFLNPVKQNGKDAMIREGEFIHPYELQGSHTTLRCDQCHTGGLTPVSTCTGCHTEQTALRGGQLAPFASFGLKPEPMFEAVDCESCHDLSEPTSVETVDAMCMDCHDDEEERFDGMLAGWKREADRLIAEAEPQLDDDGRRLLQRLRKAGPLHNIEAARIITARLVQEAQGRAAQGEAGGDANEEDEPES